MNIKRLIVLAVFWILILTLLIVPKSFSQTFPTISEIKVTQLHKDDDPIHRYQLQAVVNNPSNEKIEAFWQVDCGKLEKDKGLQVVLQYSGDCSGAKATVIVLNNNLYGQKRVQRIFIPGKIQTVNMQPKPKAPTVLISPKTTNQVVTYNKNQFLNPNTLFAIAVLIILVAVIIYLMKKKGLLVMLTSSEEEDKSCTLNDKKDCEYVIFIITVGERSPGLDESIEASINELDYYSYILKWLPTRGTTPAPKCIHEFTETLSRMHNRLREKNIIGHGANVYGKIRWKECEETGWLWKKNVWATKEDDIRINAPIEWAYQHIARPHSWKPDLIFSPQFYMNKENLEKFLDHVKREALKSCPCPQKQKDKSI